MKKSKHPSVKWWPPKFRIGDLVYDDLRDANIKIVSMHFREPFFGYAFTHGWEIWTPGYGRHEANISPARDDKPTIEFEQTSSNSWKKSRTIPPAVTIR